MNSNSYNHWTFQNDSHIRMISSHLPSGRTLGCQSLRSLFSSSPNMWYCGSLKRSSVLPLSCKYYKTPTKCENRNMTAHCKTNAFNKKWLGQFPMSSVMCPHSKCINIMFLDVNSKWYNHWTPLNPGVLKPRPSFLQSLNSKTTNLITVSLFLLFNWWELLILN